MRLAILLVALASVAHADPASKARADKLFEDGRKYLSSKEYALACTAFEQSQAADPAIGTELNIALCYEQWGKTASAYRAYVEAERLAVAKKDARAKGAHTKVDELGKAVPRLVLELAADADDSAVVLLDGKEIEHAHLADEAMLDPGVHDLEVRVAGAAPNKISIELHPGDHKRVQLDAPKPVVVAKPVIAAKPVVVVTRQAGRLHAGIGLVAGGAVLAGVAGVVALVERKHYGDAIGGCPELVCATRADFDATQQARTRANYMTFVGASGVVVLAIGAYLIATSLSETHRIVVAPAAGPDGVGVVIGGSL